MTEDVCYPSGNCLPTVDGETSRDPDWWVASDDFWDPFDAGIPLVDTAENVRLSANFVSHEFRNARHPTKSRIDPALVRYLEAFRAAVNREVRERGHDDVGIAITSGYRNLAANRDVYGWPSLSAIDDWEALPPGHEDDFRIYPKSDRFSPDVYDEDEQPKGPTTKSLTQSEHMTGRGVDVRTVDGDGQTNPYHTPAELALIALETPTETAVEGVSPCDVRVGLYGRNFVHVDVKPREEWPGPDAGYWGSVTRDIVELRERIDEEWDCSTDRVDTR